MIPYLRAGHHADLSLPSLNNFKVNVESTDAIEAVHEVSEEAAGGQGESNEHDSGKT